MSIIGFILGIISFFWMLIALIPFLGWLNWPNLVLATAGLILSALGNSRRRNGFALTGIILCAIAIFIGVIRLSIGGGFF